MSTVPYVTRIAPSPTGVFHLGTARTAYFNWLAAKASGGQFLLRIDDTDSKRNIDGADQVITDSLEWLGLAPDHMFHQSNTFEACQSAAETLLVNGKAVKEDNGAIVLKDPDLLDIDFWYDEVVGNVKVSSDDKRMAESIVLLKACGTPTYMFSSVLNDIHYKVNYVIRGVDHISNTYRQLALFNAMAVKAPKFAHIGLLRQKGKKISKRDNPMSVLDYRGAGYKPEAMLAFLVRLGWSPNDPNFNDIMTKQTAINMFFNEGHMNAKDSSVDINKLDWINKKLNKVHS